jgi:hypothetical protein
VQLCHKRCRERWKREEGVESVVLGRGLEETGDGTKKLRV